MALASKKRRKLIPAPTPYVRSEAEDEEAEDEEAEDADLFDVSDGDGAEVASGLAEERGKAAGAARASAARTPPSRESVEAYHKIRVLRAPISASSTCARRTA